MDAYDQFWQWANKPLESTLTISATIHAPVLALSETDRLDRETVNQAVFKWKRAAPEDGALS